MNQDKLRHLLQQVLQLDQPSKQVHVCQTGLDCPQSYRPWLGLSWTNKLTAWERSCLERRKAFSKQAYKQHVLVEIEPKFQGVLKTFTGVNRA